MYKEKAIWEHPNKNQPFQVITKVDGLPTYSTCFSTSSGAGCFYNMEINYYKSIGKQVNLTLLDNQ